MPPARPAKPARRFTPGDLFRMARSPSRHAPRAADVLAPQEPVPAESLADLGAKDFEFRDGRVVGVSLSGRAFISRGDDLFRLAPIEAVRLVAVQPFVGELAACPHLAKLYRLDLRGNRIGDRGLAELAASPFAGGLRELGLSGNDCGAVPNDPTFLALVALELADNRLDTIPPLPHLTALDVSRNPLRSFAFPAALRRLAASACGLPPRSLRDLGSLVELDASFNALGPDGANDLCDAVPHLNHLDLSFNDVACGGAEAVAFAPWTRLTSLNLAANRIREAGAIALAESESLGAVSHLDLSGNPIGDRGAIALLRGEAFGSLAHLNLSNCGVTDVAGLCGTGALGGLRSLSLAWNPFADIRPLARCPDLAGLEQLDLTGTPLTFAGAVALVESPHLVNLKSVGLGDNHRLPADAVGMIRGRFGTIPA